MIVIPIVLTAGVWLNGRCFEARLLRAEPQLVAFDPVLRDFAVTRGRPLFDAHCARCHGVTSRGDPSKGVPDLTDGDWLFGAGNVSDIEQVISYGIRSYNPRARNLAIMPAFARLRPSPRDSKILPLSAREIHDLVEFLVRLQRRPADNAAAERGAGLYAGKAGCYDCHAADAKGDSAVGAPNLADGVTLYGDGSRESLFSSIAYGRQGECPGWLEKLGPAGVRELAVFVSSLSEAGSTHHAGL